MSRDSARWHSAKSSYRTRYEYERLPFTSISLAALNYTPSDRIKTLAKPKLRRDTTIRENGFSRYYSDPRYSGVNPSAFTAECSERVKILSLPLKRHASFQYELPIPRPVSHRALKYEATERIVELATPKRKTRN